MESGVDIRIPSLLFLRSLHAAVPHFADKDEKTGAYQQQDAHECWSVLISNLAQTLRVPATLTAEVCCCFCLFLFVLFVSVHGCWSMLVSDLVQTLRVPATVTAEVCCCLLLCSFLVLLFVFVHAHEWQSGWSMI